MAGRMAAVVLVVLTAGARGVLGGCPSPTYWSNVPKGNDDSVWLYVYHAEGKILHTGIGTRGAYWTYVWTGVERMADYGKDTCHGSLQTWYWLGETTKNREEVEAAVDTATGILHVEALYLHSRQHYCLLRIVSQFSLHRGMAERMVAMVVAVVAAGAVGVRAGSGGVSGKFLGRLGTDCTSPKHVYRHDAPPGDHGTVWLYVFKNSWVSLHSGIGTRGLYWKFGFEGVSTMKNYTGDYCNGPLVSWYKLGRTTKTKGEVQAAVRGLERNCYPGYSKCWRFIGDHYRLNSWNCNYFTHHLAAALGVVDTYPELLWDSGIPGFCMSSCPKAKRR